jgi:hypothetical protein
MASCGTAVGAIALLVSGLPALAGPCSGEIALVQSEFDARTQAIIEAARFAREARAALGLALPHGGSFVSPGRRDADASWLGEAVAAMAEARDADGAGNTRLCEQALAAARRAISR